MLPSFAGTLDSLGTWRAGVAARLAELARFIGEHDLIDTAGSARLATFCRRLDGEKLVVAFVAEFSRGKSELINAIFFADAGRRVLPATPGRTTMCPVELGYSANERVALELLPIETRLEGRSITELREQPGVWISHALDPAAPDRLAEVLGEVTRTKSVGVDEARALGLWHDDRPDDNPPLDSQQRVEVPAWRHALINYPHALLQRGLVILDTPGLNAIGAEPELTLGLLPTAHATVFVLAADSGVTKSDLTVWRDYLVAHASARYVVLNKIDALADPLTTPEGVRLQIERQQDVTAAQLGIARRRVFPLSAREALAARIAGDGAALLESRLPELERALTEDLLPQRRDLLRALAREALAEVETHMKRRIADSRRSTAEQMLELRGLRGKSAAKVRLLLQRIDSESSEFERCITKLQAFRSVQARMQKETLEGLSGERLRAEAEAMRESIAKSLFNLGAKKAFLELCDKLRHVLHETRERCAEAEQMIAAQFSQLNAEFGFSLARPRTPDIAPFVRDLDEIERNYSRYVGLANALKLSEPRFMEQFRRMLVAKLRVVFDAASVEIELWNKTASAQVDSQLRERRRDFRRRRDALERIRTAAGELEQRLAEVEAQDERLTQLSARAATLLERVREHVDADPGQPAHLEAPRRKLA